MLGCVPGKIHERHFAGRPRAFRRFAPRFIPADALDRYSVAYFGIVGNRGKAEGY
jgi:hypothetical protein